jgi:hypothetical protein
MKEFFFLFTTTSRQALGSESDQSPPSSAEVKMSGAVPPFSQYIVTAWCIIKQGTSFHGGTLLSTSKTLICTHQFLNFHRTPLLNVTMKHTHVYDAATSAVNLYLCLVSSHLLFSYVYISYFYRSLPLCPTFVII